LAFDYGAAHGDGGLHPGCGLRGEGRLLGDGLLGGERGRLRVGLRGVRRVVTDPALRIVHPLVPNMGANQITVCVVGLVLPRRACRGSAAVAAEQVESALGVTHRLIAYPTLLDAIFDVGQGDGPWPGAMGCAAVLGS